MDFYQIKERSTKSGVVEIYPDFKVGRSKDLMVRGRSFYAIWDDEKSLWSTDEYDVQRLVDAALIAHKNETKMKNDGNVTIKLMSDFSSNSWSEFRKYLSHISDNAHQLDTKLTFLNTPVTKKDYVSKRLPYPLQEGSIDAYDELISVLYSEEERGKLEWSIGAVISGDARDIQKFIVLYGEAGTGKSTVLNIIQKLFEGYYTTFEAKALTSSSNAFATEVFKSNPLVAIQHDGDLSKIEDNTKLNSIVSHEEMTLNEKYKPSYTARINSFLYMGTNKPVKITDAKSGIIRRLIDVRPTGQKIPAKKYQTLMAQIEFELGAIAYHCLNVYNSMGKNYYSSYRPLEMMLQTDVFYNFVEANFFVFKEQDGVSLSQAYELYKVYCDDALVEFKLPKYKFREEMKNYFENFHEVTRIDGNQIRSYYSGFLKSKFTKVSGKKEEHQYSLVLDSTESLFDNLFGDCKAQYATVEEIPSYKWDNVTTKLSELDPNKLHYVKLPENHIVIDFDLKDSTGNKSLELNLEAASKWPSTYAEYSKSGSGIHLHYNYDGDTSRLSRIFSEGIEIKVFTGNSSLRRKLTKCNNNPITTLNSGLPLKGDAMLNFEAVKNEKALRTLIKKNLNKEIHPGTKPSIDFIHKILEDAYSSGLNYDVTDMRPAILSFASNSSNQSEYCVKLVSRMMFKSDEASEAYNGYTNDDLVFFDVEVYPNLFVVCWKEEGKEKAVNAMINPKASDIERLLKRKLVGFNCRRYDNHILYAAYLGYTIDQLYKLSQRIIDNSENALFSEAYNLSYTDIFDLSTKKQSLKKFMIELGIHHIEMSIPWDQPVPEELWSKVVEYCKNDVSATEDVFVDRKQDYVARLILAELSGLSPNDTTQQHTARIIFGKDPKPQDKFVYTDLSEMFPGYKFDKGKSIYKDIEVGEGGYVYAEPGMYSNVALIDVASMHPTSAINMNIFGPYTERYKELMDARLAIKHKDYEKAGKLLNGILVKYLDNPEESEALSYALKIVINIVYGLTSASFPNKFKDPRNIDNIVAKRGALFMIDLQHVVQQKGYTVAHIKTDSIKIPNADSEIIEFVQEFATKYGYTFEHEATYEKMCLVNDAVYIAKYRDGKHAGQWTATGAQFAHPYIFKTLFTKEPLVFSDLCETKSVSSFLYLDMNENYPEVKHLEKIKELRRKSETDIKMSNSDLNSLNAFKHVSDEELDERIAEGHNYHFIGKVSSFCPVSIGGGILLREKDGKYYAATGTKGYRWLEAEVVKNLCLEDTIDMTYFEELLNDAVDTISIYGDFETFVSENSLELKKNPTWLVPCGDFKFETCFECKHYLHGEECELGYNTSQQIPF